MSHTNAQPSFLIAALLAGRLYRVLTVAKTMSISSSNAKAISIRGGTKTAGFKPITEFISDMAKDTISISAEINALALKFSITAANEKRMIPALIDFKRAVERIDKQNRKDSITLLINTLDEKISALRVEQYNICRILSGLFDDITQRIRATRIIVTNSRTEASRANQYKKNLFSIADDLEYCSESITSEIKVCKHYLEDLTNMIGKK
jgi:hypothetical protein